MISEIALTLTLLVAAGLVLKSFSRMQSLQLGYEPRNLFSARVELPWKTYSSREKISTFTKALLDKVTALPGVQNAGIGSNSPLMGGWQTGFWREGPARPTPSQHVSCRPRGRHRRLFFNFQDAAFARPRLSTSATRKIPHASSSSIRQWPNNIFRVKIRSANVSSLMSATMKRAM